MDGANGLTGGNNCSNSFVLTAFISFVQYFPPTPTNAPVLFCPLLGFRWMNPNSKSHLGCPLFFSPFSLLPPIPVTYLPIHLRTSSFTQPSLLPTPPFAESSLPLCVNAFCRVESHVRLQAAKLVSCSGIDICYSLKMTSTSASTVCICLGVHPICQL